MFVLYILWPFPILRNKGPWVGQITFLRDAAPCLAATARPISISTCLSMHVCFDRGPIHLSSCQETTRTDQRFGRVAHRHLPVVVAFDSSPRRSQWPSIYSASKAGWPESLSSARMTRGRCRMSRLSTRLAILALLSTLVQSVLGAGPSVASLTRFAGLGAYANASPVLFNCTFR